jgi:hypothetical protein
MRADTMRRWIAAPLLAVALAASARAETLVVGEAAVGAPLWELGVAYAPMNATVGDELVRARLRGWSAQPPPPPRRRPAPRLL